MIDEQSNQKTMLSPQKSLKVNAFARDLVNGIIMQEIQEDKVQEDVLKS